MANYDVITLGAGTPTGLLVSGIYDADAAAFATIEKAISGKDAKARDGNRPLAEMQGGSLTTPDMHNTRPRTAR